jgi:hypothetical protein
MKNVGKRESQEMIYPDYENIGAWLRVGMPLFRLFHHFSRAVQRVVSSCGPLIGRGFQQSIRVGYEVA